MSDSLKFGTSGLRGLAVDLAGAAARAYASAFLKHLKDRGEIAPGSRVLIGGDLRASSPAIASDVAQAVLAGGHLAVDCGHLPTPALALAAMRLRLPAIMVTGSHIPADRNGLKFYRAAGEIDKDDEAGIVAALATPAPNGIVGPVTEDDSVLAAYAARYAMLLPKAALSGKRIGVYQHSSVARDLLVDVLQGFGAEIVALGRSDVFVPIDTEAVLAEDAAQMAAWVKEHRLDALVSTDGDADRPLMVDNEGALIRGDVIGILTARALCADAVVTPVTSSSAVESTGFFASTVRTKVGSPFVIAGMSVAREAGAKVIVGFEANGGVLLGSDVIVNGVTLTALPTRDALLPMLAVLGAMSEGTLADLVRSLPPRFARSGRLEHIPHEQSARLIAALVRNGVEFFEPMGEVAAISDIDGMRFTLTSGDVVHYRPSGNAPELRCYSEAANALRADHLLAWGLDAAKRVVR